MPGRKPLSGAEVKRRAALERERMEAARKETTRIKEEALARVLAETRQILRRGGATTWQEPDSP
jgi:hypothetical protein